MGRVSIYLALGASIIIAILIVSLNANTSFELDTTLEYYKETQARLISNSGIEIYLEKLRRNKSLTGNFNNNTLNNGSYDVSIYGPDTLLTIKSTGRFMDKVHVTSAVVKRQIVGIPNINSALYVSSTNMVLDLNGNMDIDGNDHTSDGVPIGGNSLPGVSVDSPSDSAFIVNDLKPKISNAIQGTGGSPSVRTVNDTVDWKSLTEEYIFASDYTLPSGTYTTGTVLGTPSEPKITYANGDVQFSGNATGSGIMIVNGNLTLSGNFTFKGIIIAYGKSTIVTKTVGNSGIFGAAIFVGQTVDIQATGNSKFYYSKQSIDNAKTNLKSSRFKIISWWE